MLERYLLLGMKVGIPSSPSFDIGVLAEPSLLLALFCWSLLPSLLLLGVVSSALRLVEAPPGDWLFLGAPALWAFSSSGYPN